MTAYIPLSDAANVLVNDIGSSVGDSPVSLPRSNLSVAPNLSNAITNDTTSNKTHVWGVRSEDALKQRFGAPSDPKNVNQPWKTGDWSCRATSFVKACSVEGYLGNSIVYKESVDLRVYQEIVPSAASYWNAYEESRATKPILPYYWRLPGGNFGSGSIPLDPGNSCPNSFWNVLFVGWADELGYKRFALIDYYPIFLVTETFTTAQYLTAVSVMNAKPQNSSGKSTQAGLVQNFIKNNYYSGGSVSGGEGTSGQGRILLPKIPGQETTKYYLTDDSLKPQMKEQASRLPTRVTSSTNDKPAVYTGDKIILTDIVVDPEYISYYKPPGTQYVYSPRGSSIVHTSFHIEKSGAKKQILATETTHTELENLKLDMKVSGTNAALITVDGITLTQGLNYVKSNLEFVDGNVTIANWGVSKRGTSDKYFGGHVVDGQYISGTQYNSIEGVITGSESRSDYYYVLPGFQRVTEGSVVKHLDVVETESGARTAIRGGDLAQRGRHGGKFLKTAGFTIGGIGKYRDAQEAKLKDGALTSLANKIFNGYFYGYNFPVPKGGASAEYAFQFNLKNYPGLPASSSSYPSYPGYPGGPGGTESSTTDTSAANRAKYLKVINDAKSTLASGANVSFDILKTNLLSLGIPLYTIRDEVLRGLEAGKIAYLMRTRRYTLETAKLEWQKDPLYLAINKFFTASSSSQSSSGGGKDKNKNKNKNNKNGNNKNNKGGNADTAGASSQNDTVKITVTRGLAGYVKGVRSTGNTRSRPTLIQTYEGMKSSKQINGTPIRSFEFPFVPSQVNYTGLGINWTEIERTGSYPIVDWSSFQLLKISFNFDIVSMAQENQAGFGLYYSCEDQILELREMAQAPYPVTFLNMDKFMQDEIRWPSLNTGRGIEFVIQEFSVTATQRTSSNPTALVSSTVPNQISRASCTMTLQEIPIENVDIVQMPPIKPCKKECEKDKIIKLQDSKHPLFSTTITSSN